MPYHPQGLGHVDVLLDQFSLAAYAGFEPPEEHLRKRADQILRNVSAVHQALRTTVTIPFASLIYFSSEDNEYINPLTNTVRDAYDYLEREGQDCVVLYPGDTYGVGSAYDCSRALKRFDELPSRDSQPLWFGFKFPFGIQTSRSQGYFRSANYCSMQGLIIFFTIDLIQYL